MRVKKIRGATKTLFAIDARIGRTKWRKAGAPKRELSRDELLRRPHRRSRLHGVHGALPSADAAGLTPRQIIDKFRTVKMVDVVMPTTDGRTVTLPRYVEPKDDVALLLDRLGFTLPEQPPPKISADVAEAAQTAV